MSTDRNTILKDILSLEAGDEPAFYALAEQVFAYQSTRNSVYASWLTYFPSNCTSLFTIPKMHISAWKRAKVVTDVFEPELVYTSSATTSDTVSKHYVRDNQFYLENTVKGFQSFYGNVADYCVLGLLPSYMERTGSSLVTMVDHFINISNYSESGTFLYDHDELYRRLMHCKSTRVKTLLIGVSFGLLDFLENYSMDFPELIVMETGGMKGRRKEITRSELHEQLISGFGVQSIHSEYGMTELMSQAYSRGNGVFECSPTMRVFISELNDPFAEAKTGKAGMVNIIDLANIDSCSFIITDDIGIKYADGTFEILGRLDHSDIRGCNLMVSDLR